MHYRLLVPALVFIGACSPDATGPLSDALNASLRVDVSGHVSVVERVSASVDPRGMQASPLPRARVAAYRVASPGEPGAVHVTTVPATAFWGVPIGTVETRDDGSFTMPGLAYGVLHVVMLTEEPRRGGCIGQAGMLRMVRPVAGMPMPPIELSY